MGAVFVAPPATPRDAARRMARQAAFGALGFDQAATGFVAAYLRGLLERHRWNVTAAAREARVGRQHIHKLMKQHSVGRPA